MDINVLFYVVFHKIERALQDMHGGELVDDGAAFFAADVGLFDQKPLHGGG